MLRVVKHLVGQAVLDNLAALHNHQPVRQQPHHAEVVGHHDPWNIEPFTQACNLGVKCLSGDSVHGREWLIKQQHARLPCQCAGQGNTLALTP